jgi:hypothetical protein
MGWTMLVCKDEVFNKVIKFEIRTTKIQSYGIRGLEKMGGKTTEILELQVQESFSISRSKLMGNYYLSG